MSAPLVRVTCCGEEVPETEIPPSFLEKGIRRCRRCASGQGVSPQRLPDRIPIPTTDEWAGYLRRGEIRRAVAGG